MALRSLLRGLGIAEEALTSRDLQETEIETQMPYAGSRDEQSRIDLQIRLRRRFLVFLEAKLGNAKLPKRQLRKYAEILDQEGAGYDCVRLVLVTQWDGRLAAEKWSRSRRSGLRLKPGQFRYMRWEEIRELIASTRGMGKLRFLNRLFLEYVGDMMSDKRVIKEQLIGKVTEVMIASTDPDWWDLAVKEGIVCQDNNSPDVRYVAFYRTKPEAAITHIAEVGWTERNVSPRHTYRSYPRILKKGKARGWIDKPHKVYHLKELIKLPVPIPKRPGHPAIRVKVFKSMSELLKARYLDDLARITTRRAAKA